ncbi:MAG: hypothetical protein ACLPY2_24230 [Bryobacteraceae bacterium]|jgi:hypothetical protein
MYQDYKDLLSVFHAHGVKYLIVWGYAVIFYAQPARRRTPDVVSFHQLEYCGEVHKMGLSTVREIERAIGALAPQELEELYSWLDQHCPQPIDVRVQSDLAAGRLDRAIHRALDDEKNGRVQPL